MHRSLLVASLALASLPPRAQPAAPAASTPPIASTAAACAVDARRANLNFTLKDIDDRKVKLSAFKGKVILLDFWATWCGPCKTEIPWFIEFQDKYRNDGLQVIGVSVDDTREKLVPYARELEMNYTVLQARGNERVLDAYGPIAGIPVTVLISRDGRICGRYEGAKTKEAIESGLKALLAR